MRLKRVLLSVCIIAIIKIFNFGIFTDSASIIGLDISKNNKMLFIEHAPAIDNNCSIYSVNLFKRLNSKIPFRELSSNTSLFIDDSFLTQSDISDFNIFFHIQRNHLHIARLKAG